MAVCLPLPTKRKNMEIALIGYGKMGHAIEAMAPERGHRIVCTIDTPEEWDARQQALKDADVAIEFSTPATAAGNLRRCLEMGVAVVCGTTGWYDDYDSISALCREKGGSLFTATNFSIGMNIMFALNEKLDTLMAGHPEYSVSISETHHIHKLDAPSGTAITLRGQIHRDDVPIESIREGEVPGTHTVRYDSDIDSIMLTHEAHSRRGLALGALMAAEYLKDKQGVFTMKDLLAL